MAFKTGKHSTTGKLPSLVEKWWNHLMLVDHLKKSLMTIHHTDKAFHDMWKRAFYTASSCIAEPKEYNKQRYDKTHKEPEVREGYKAENAVKVRLTEEFCRKHTVFPLSLIKPYHQTGDDKIPFGNKSHTPQDIVEVEGSLRPVKKEHEGQENET
ncbi:hypothetical protein O181_010872 [Austropuccinia psidii MF-1]|uniref:Uncharacterized protein n=1 Tax=Austropuccinia psidii MF-1 TaxID=1389203 RepID=A0A9Q3BTI3_9BASI|nr:hypothetical protein [Austropuccinia psidii MF-1]